MCLLQSLLEFHHSEGSKRRRDEGSAADHCLLRFQCWQIHHPRSQPSLQSCVSIMLGAAHTRWEVVLLAGGDSPGMDGGSRDSAGENFSSRPLEGSALGSLWANKRQAEGERCDFTWLKPVQLHKKRQTLLFAEWGQGEHISKTERFFRKARHWGNISKARERGWGKASSAQAHLPQGLRNYVNCRELLVSCKRIAHLVKSIPWKLFPVFLATAAGYHGLFPHIFSCFFFFFLSNLTWRPISPSEPASLRDFPHQFTDWK